MKKIICILSFILLPFTLQAQTLAQAEQSYQDGDFTAAKAQYAKIWIPLPAIRLNKPNCAPLRANMGWANF